MCIRDSIWATLWEPALAGLGLSYKEGLDEAARGTAGDSMRAVLRRFYGPDCEMCIRDRPMAPDSASGMRSTMRMLS